MSTVHVVVAAAAAGFSFQLNFKCEVNLTNIILKLRLLDFKMFIVNCSTHLHYRQVNESFVNNIRSLDIRFKVKKWSSITALNVGPIYITIPEILAWIIYNIAQLRAVDAAEFVQMQWTGYWHKYSVCSWKCNMPL